MAKGRKKMTNAEQEYVSGSMHKTLRGPDGKVITNPKQKVAVLLNEYRRGQKQGWTKRGAVRKGPQSVRRRPKLTAAGKKRAKTIKKKA